MKSSFLSFPLILGAKYDYFDMVKLSIWHSSMATYDSLVSFKILKIICTDEKILNLAEQLNIIDSRCLRKSLLLRKDY